MQPLFLHVNWSLDMDLFYLVWVWSSLEVKRAQTTVGGQRNPASCLDFFPLWKHFTTCNTVKDRRSLSVFSHQPLISFMCWLHISINGKLKLNWKHTFGPLRPLIFTSFLIFNQAFCPNQRQHYLGHLEPFNPTISPLPLVTSSLPHCSSQIAHPTPTLG